MKHLLPAIILCMLVGCSRSPKQVYDRYSHFPETISLKAESLSTDTVLLRYAFRVAALDSILIIQDLHNTDYYLHAFSLPEGKHITSFVPRGEGPEEMVICETFQFNSLDSIWALDPNKMEIHRYRLDPAGQQATREEHIRLDRELIRSLDMIVTSEGFIVPDYTGNFRYHQLNWQGEIIRSGGVIPKENKEDPSIAMAQGWRAFFDYNEKNDRLVAATQLGEVMEIYSLKDTTHIVKYGPHGEPLYAQHDGNGLPNGIMGFVDVQITDKYIYLVFEGTWFEEQITQYMQGNQPLSGGNRIYVFDHNGNPVRKYELDHPIYSLHVNEKKGIFYALDLNLDEPLLKYSF